jgi:hypothetical protein
MRGKLIDFMNDKSKLTRLLLVSPWFLLVFLIIPLLVILSITLHIGLPLASTGLLLVNNICLMCLVACRLLRYVFLLGKKIRYGAEYGRPRRSVTLQLPVAEVKGELRIAGYDLADGGEYAEKRGIGYLGTTVVYGGLFILLSVGVWDNLRHFSGVVLDSVGPATDLNKAESYRRLNKGLIAPGPNSLPRMLVIGQHLPDYTYPMGATEVAFLSADQREQKNVLKPLYPIRYGDFDIYMAKFVYEPQIVIKTRDGRTLFNAFVQLDPLVEKRGGYDFYGLFESPALVGGVYYQPEKSLLKVVISNSEKKVVADMAFQTDQQVVRGDYVLSCAKMGQWSEIHVVRRRHKVLLWLGGAIAVIGLLLRGANPPQRVWLEEMDEGSRVRVCGKETKKLLKVEG